MIRLWSTYIDHAGGLRDSIVDVEQLPSDIDDEVCVVIASLPQLVLALAGGMLGRFLISRFATVTGSDSRRVNEAHASAANA